LKSKPEWKMWSVKLRCERKEKLERRRLRKISRARRVRLKRECSGK